MKWSRPWDDIAGFMRRAAVGEAASHLRALEIDGVVRVEEGEPAMWSLTEPPKADQSSSAASRGRPTCIGRALAGCASQASFPPAGVPLDDAQRPLAERAHLFAASVRDGGVSLKGASPAAAQATDWISGASAAGSASGNDPSAAPSASSVLERRHEELRGAAGLRGVALGLHRAG